MGRAGKEHWFDLAIVLVYVEFGNAATDSVSLDFFLSDTSGSTTTLGAMLRKWNVRITQIPCGSNYE